MISKLKQSAKSKRPAKPKGRTKSEALQSEIEDDLRAAIRKIGENELRALVFGYLHAKEQGTLFAGKASGGEDPFDRFLERSEKDQPELTMAAKATVEALAVPKHEVFFDANARALARDPVGDIMACIFAAFNRKGLPITTRTTPSQVFTTPGAWTGVALQIYACVAAKYPKFSRHATPTSADRFWNATIETFAREIHKIAV